MYGLRDSNAVYVMESIVENATICLQILILIKKNAMCIHAYGTILVLQLITVDQVNDMSYDDV